MNERPCPNCGAAEFVDGWIKAMDAGSPFFVAEGRGVGDWLLSRKKGDLSARMCAGCGRLDLFVLNYSED